MDMIYLGTALVAVLLVAAWTLAINGVFLRCPHCRRRGTWRLHDLEPPVEEIDAEGVVQSSTTRQSCISCSGEVIQTWSDREGRKIEKA